MIKITLTIIVAIIGISTASASEGYLSCLYTEHAVTGESVETEIAGSIDRLGNGEITSRIGRVTVLVEMKNYTQLRLQLVDLTLTAKAKKSVEANESVTTSLPEAYGTTRDGRAYRGVTLSCRYMTY